MSKVSRNKTLFLDLIGDSRRFDAWQSLINRIDNEVPIGGDQDLTAEILFKMRRYEGITSNPQFLEFIKRLSNLERDMLNLLYVLNLKVTIGSIAREDGDDYVLLRSPFIIDGQDRDELRIYYGKLSTYGFKSIDEAKNNPEFMEQAKNKMREEMMSIMHKYDIANTYVG